MSKLSLALALAIPVAFATLGTPVLMEAQAISGDILGVVMDSSGAVVPNVQVVATNIGTGVKTTTVTNGGGEYHFINLPVGHYSLQVSGNGMSGGYKDVEVLLNKRSTANITAAVAAASTSIEVSTTATTIDTTTPQIQSTFENQQVQDIPTATIGLGVLNLSLLNAGVATSGGIGLGTGPSISGQRPRNNNFTIEGVDNNDKGVTGPLVTVPNDAIQNFTVLQNQFSAEYGHSSGGQFNETLVSGTNQWHGRLYEYFQNRNLNAIDASSARTQTGPNFVNSEFDNNRFGGQVGGPIVKDKVFFFTNQEYNPVHFAVAGQFACAPTAAGYAALQTLPGLSQTNFTVLQNSLGTAATQAALDGSGNCAPTTGGSVGAPVGEIDFNPNTFSNTYTTANSVDVNLSEKDQIRGRYIFERNNQQVVPQLPKFTTDVPFRAHVFTFSEYHTFGPTLTNELRLGYNRTASNFPAGNFSFPGLDSFPNLIFFDSFNDIGPGDNLPQSNTLNLYQAVDNINWIKGKHNFKFGIEGRDYISPQQFTQRARGDYEWNTTEDYLQDLSPTAFGQRSTGSNNYYGNQKAIYWYAADDFRITKNLTLNLGIRYEYTEVPFTEQLQSLNSAASVPGFLVFGAPQAPKNDWAPRIGFAYSPGNNADTTIRGGFALTYDVLYDNLGLLAVPPQFGGTCDVFQSVNGTGGCSWSDTAFLASGGLPPGKAGGGLQSFATVADQRAATVNFIPDNIKYPYSETWDLGIEHVFAKKYTAEVRYVGTRGIHLPVQQQLNVQPKVTSSLFLPTFLTPPDAATVAGLTTTLAQIQAQPRIIPAFTANGFVNGITSFQPLGQSKYDGLQAQLTRTFSNGLQFQGAYTWSHAFDNSTADVFSTVLTPRRPQNSQNFAADYSTSALDRRQRLSLSTIYDLPYFKNSSNWLAKNLLGNWEVTPVWQLQSGEPWTPQSGVDANLNGDNAPDRTIFNPNGVPGTGTTVTPLKNASGATVGYVALDPNAQYIQAQKGALSNIGRNTLLLPRTNNWDLTVVKSIKTTEKTTLQFQAQAFNVFNHSQFIAGSVNTVEPHGFTGITNFVRVNGNHFNDPTAIFNNNARTMQLAAKFIF
ncbi:MAG TPA: TonB-dependent receptor [Terriglobales bacterium]|nr:TonB-dependent receptor [Terriglobales bacterium]